MVCCFDCKKHSCIKFINLQSVTDIAVLFALFLLVEIPVVDTKSG